MLTDPKAEAERTRKEGITLFAAGQREEAIKKLQEAVDLDPDSGEANRSLGQAISYRAARDITDETRKKAELARAEQLLNKARELRGDTVSILHDLAWIYDERRNFSAAVDLYTQALEVGGTESPDNDLTPVRYNRACAFAKLHRVAEAVAELKLILSEPWRKGEVRDWLDSDNDFDEIRGTVEWKSLMGTK